MKNPSLFFYSDASEWGGHEALSARIASALAESGNWDVSYMFYTDQFEHVLSEKVRRIRVPYCASTPFPIIRDRSYKKRKMAKGLLLRERPHYLVICPGNIERCMPMVLAAEELGIPLVNYYPMGFTQVESGAVLGKARDWLALSIYPKYSQWIVYSDSQERLLRRFIKPETPVRQIPIPLPWGELLPPRMPGRVLKLATIGRVYFGQKGQDVIPPLAARLRDAGMDVHFSILGTGPHEQKLLELAKSYGVEDRVSLHKWVPSSEVRRLLREEFDALFIPSHFESGPIVLFEALECGIPVIVADADYVADYNLPAWMVYRKTELSDAFQKIKDLSTNWNEGEFHSARERLFAPRTDSAFRDTVHQVFSDINGNMNHLA